jgi:hypothetical protein
LKNTSHGYEDSRRVALRLMVCAPSSDNVEVSTPTAIVPPTLAPQERAEANFAANCEAFKHHQPLPLDRLTPLPDGLQWVLARDGSITALNADGTWWAGCSLPWRAARSMFKTLKLESLFGCFLSPGWAAQLRLCLDLIEPRQALVAACPSVAELVVMLHCESFAEDIAAGRLWFAAGEDWPAQIETIFDTHPGLIVPSQFIRAMSQHKDKIEAMIPPAQKALAEINIRRNAKMAEASSLCRGTSGWKPLPLCIVCPSQFSLWQDAGPALAELLGQLTPDETSTISCLDPDRPTSASTLALAKVAAECDALLISDVGRGDLAGIVSTDVAWITWVTRGTIPDANAAGPRDRVLLADRSWQRVAIDSGWAKERTAIAEWPTAPMQSAVAANPPYLAVIVDTLPGQAPKAVSDFSSQAVFWEHIRRELLNDPFAVGDDAEVFLDRLIRELEIAAEALDRRVFINELIIPAYQQGLAMHLVRGGVPIKIFGRGWDAVSARPESAILENAWAGPLRSAAELRAAVAGAVGLVHVWPSRTAHPIDRYGKPVLGSCRSATAFVREANRVLGAGIPASPAASPLCLRNMLKQPQA